MNNNKLSLIIKHFSPAWFAASMGTGGIANLLYQLGKNNAALRALGQTFFVINIVIFGVLLIPWVLRWFMHIKHVVIDIKHPIMSNFFVTMPVSGIILGTNLMLMGNTFLPNNVIINLSLIFWIFGTVFSLILGVYVLFNIFIIDEVHPNTINFSWFITPVASVVVPLLGNGLVKYYFNVNLDLANFINIIDLSFYGIGMFLFIILFGVVVNRFIYHKMPHAMMLPTFWIMLGPIGVGTIALVGLADINVMLGFLETASSIKLLSIILWGFGLWTFGFSTFITVLYLGKGEIPFTLSWWAFIFPIVSYASGTLVIYSITNASFILGYTFFLTVIVVIIWLVTFIKTLVGIINLKMLLPEL